MKDTKKIFSQLIDDIIRTNDSDKLIHECVNFNIKEMQEIPLRYRIIALGFVRCYSLEELNDSLEEHGCPKLYSRNFWEATLIFAFKNGLSYEKWQELSSECMDIYSSVGDSRWFTEKKIIYRELERYILDNSDSTGSLMFTEQKTVLLQRELEAVGNDLTAFRNFLDSNVRSFSRAREKTRYYFCKYLYYYLNQKIEDYLLACRKKAGIDDALCELMALKVVTKLRRNLTMPEEDKLSLIRESAISCGEIFDSFNYFYFEYVSMDWAEILLECYSRPESIPEKHRKPLASLFRKSNPEYRSLTDIEVIRRQMEKIDAMEDEKYSLDGSRGYGKNRAGENTLYKYIKGTLDIDRTVLLCFLIFFDAHAVMPEEHKLSTERLQHILMNCGYPALNMEDDFDWFVMEYLENSHPQEFLNEVLFDYARNQKNSFLYHIYGSAVNYNTQLESTLL